MTTQRERIILSPPHMSGDELRFVHEAFESGWIAPLGPQVDAFERETSDYIGRPQALALSSGTAALHLGLRLLGVETGDVVLCSSLTFIASVSPVTFMGAKPYFVDSDEDTWNMSPRALERAIDDLSSKGIKPKAAIVAELYGQAPKWDELMPIFDRHDIPVLEDSAEALGAEYDGRKCGTFGRYSVLSYNGNKIITTSGGGMLLLDDPESREKAFFWATQARDKAPWYQHSEIGYNYRMSNVLAAIGRGQMLHLDERVEAKRAVYERYEKAFSDIPGIALMPEAKKGKSSMWLTSITVDPDETGTTAMDIWKALGDENIESRPVWKPMHLQPVFEGCGYASHDDGISVGDRLFENGLCLPSGTSMTELQQDRVIETVRKALKR
ncbi:DegT/DnrJ/EryC1/StrS aminotransferase [Dethiosulfovibrio peptidovorans DSM 11002]|uniref:DegT/DnrJ/EryC1/StrS aminotransferase n=1 Tax=Dethiosulfovibrio peptidovorans DSM 11002 TaxID=469381 RepID=D2Z5I0_9BACT|nr:aminotransferase class I/II-fold pyridoxal phosphate-dependent enzyme [Dethiosulfovibrio peptidovorans]EFC90727.1 DegT/DnrJ/EryC1/StrS aminotransferase [Dethiosulfovibrio peptidovorans DSM 11002]